MSWRVAAPDESSKRADRYRSDETDLSATSIFAIRDWLDPICLAISNWVSLRVRQRTFSLSASARLDLDQRFFLLAEAEEIRGRADLPAGCFEFAAFGVSHCIA